MSQNLEGPLDDVAPISYTGSRGVSHMDANSEREGASGSSLLDLLSRKSVGSRAAASRWSAEAPRKLSLLKAVARGRRLLLPGSNSNEGHFSDDETDRDEVCGSDGLTFDSDGHLGSEIGSISGERSDGSDPDYSPSSSDESCEMDVSKDEEEYHQDVIPDVSDPTIDRPVGMMLAKENANNSGERFVCSKIRQMYINRDCDPPERFEVVFKDGSTSEYSRDEVLQYRGTYLENEGEDGCDEFFFRV